MTKDLTRLRDMAVRYTAAWCSHDAASVAAFFAPDGSLRVNDAAPAIGRTAVAAVAQEFMTAFLDLQVLMDGLAVEDGAGRSSAPTPGRAGRVSTSASRAARNGASAPATSSPLRSGTSTPKNTRGSCVVPTPERRATNGTAGSVGRCSIRQGGRQ